MLKTRQIVPREGIAGKRFHLHGQTTRFCLQTRNLEMLYLSPWLLLRIEGLINKPMQALGKPVWREKTRLTSPEVRVAETSKAWRDLGRPLFSLDLGLNQIVNLRGKKWLTYDVSGAAWNITYCPIGQLSWRHRLNFRPANRCEKCFKMA